MTRWIRWTLVVAMATAAQQAAAQAGSPLPGSRTPTTPPASTPPVTTPPPSTTPSSTNPLPGSSPNTTATSPGGANDPTAADTIRQVHELNVQIEQIGMLASKRGTTSNVKDYGKRITDEHQRFDQELAKIAQKRGIPLASVEQIGAEPTHAAAMARLNGLSGLQFDQAVMDLLVQEREGRVPHLKQLRDRTPGRDAELKKWLSDMEVTMEHTRNEARNVRQAVRQEEQKQQRQGRKP